jgi:hypothetical protein
MDHQEGMVTFLGRLAIRGSLCLLLSQMRNHAKGCTGGRRNVKFRVGSVPWLKADVHATRRESAQARVEVFCLRPARMAVTWLLRLTPSASASAARSR